MDEQEVSASLQLINDGVYPMYFGISCAFVGLHHISRGRRLDLELGQWARMGELMLQGSTHLLGLLLGRAQGRVEALEEGLKRAASEVWELKRRRAEDAKANEKVVGIFAGHEQSWIAERKRLRIQVQALMNELRIVKARNNEAVLDLNRRVEEEEQALQIKQEELEEGVKMRKEIEERLLVAEEVVEELRERAKKEAQDHSSELWKHKTAFVELVSNQRQLEADLGRALWQTESTKQELDEVFEQKEEAVSMVNKLSVEMSKLQKDAEQKDKILSAMLRKSKFDMAEKHMLLKEVKISKAKKKQAELDSERWRNMWESRNKKSSRLLKSVETGSSEEIRPEFQLRSSEYRPRTLLLEYMETESRKEHESPLRKCENIIRTVHCLDQYSSNETNDPDHIPHLQDWVRLDTENYTTTLEQRDHTDIEAFTEQMRLKDEKLEAFQWQLLSMGLESKRLQSHIEGLDGCLSQLRDENLKLATMLMEREKELKSLKEQLDFSVQHWQKSNSKVTSCTFDQAISREKERERKSILVRKQQTTKNMIQERDDQDTNDSSPPSDHLKDYPIIYINEISSEEPRRTESSAEDEERSMTLVTQIPNDEIEEEKEVSMDPIHSSKQFSFHEMTEMAINPSSVQKSFKDSSWRMDIHALGVSYKIKRLKQQLLVLERVAGVQGTKQSTIEGLPMVTSLLHKQVKRYQSLEEKTDDLCRKMQESYRIRSSRDAHNDSKKEQTGMLESFLGETFQLQRYMVATGQKLLEIQSKISCIFPGSDGLDESAGFSMRQFADIVRNLFKDIQRGLEVRIARVIGDLEGTLACDGILHS